MSKRVLFLFLICFFALWECYSHFSSRLLFVLPPPSAIALTLWEMKERFWVHTYSTLLEMGGGFLLALTAAFPLAWIMTCYKTSRTLLQPLFIITQCLPIFTLAPLMVIWFGWGYTAILIPTALMIFFPLTLNIYQGLRSTPQELLNFFASNQATAWQTFIKLRLPWAAGHIFAGLRISAAIAGVGAVAGEWAGAQQGLGVLMLESRRAMDLDMTFGALACLTFISMLFYVFILFCEKNVLPPRPWIKLLKKYFRQRSQKRKSRFVLPLLLFCFTMSLGGCRQSNSLHTTRLLLDWLPNPNHIPLYVGLRHGFFQEAGIDLKIQKMQDCCGGIPFLTSRQTDLLIHYMPGTFKACSMGAQIKIIGVLYKEPLSGLIYRDDLNVQKMSDLSGHTLGYCIESPDAPFLDLILENAHITPSCRKNASSDLIAAIGTRSVDFIYGGFWNIEPFQLLSKKIETKTFKIQELGVPTYYEMIILAHANTKESSYAYVTAFKHALQKSIDFCKQNPKTAFNDYLTCHPDKRMSTVEWEKNAWELSCSLLANDQFFDMQTLHTFYEWLVGQKIISKHFDIQSIAIN